MDRERLLAQSDGAPVPEEIGAGGTVIFTLGSPSERFLWNVDKPEGLSDHEWLCVKTARRNHIETMIKGMLPEVEIMVWPKGDGVEVSALVHLATGDGATVISGNSVLLGPESEKSSQDR